MVVCASAEILLHVLATMLRLVVASVFPPTSPSLRLRRRARWSGTILGVVNPSSRRHCLEGHAWEECLTLPQGYKPSKQVVGEGLSYEGRPLQEACPAPTGQGKPCARVPFLGATTSSEV